jgi:CheY-like chemotaxis protein
MKKNILVVDDDRLILYALTKILSEQGYNVVTAETATRAIEKISFCPFDLCLIDVHLPDLNGIELMKVIKGICPITKIMIMTASYLNLNELSGYLENAFANGASQFITKPFDSCDLTEMIEKVLLGKTEHSENNRFDSTGSEKKSRKHSRNIFNKNVFFQVSVIEEGDYTRKSLEGQGIDISDSGIGFFTLHPMHESLVVSFDESLDNRMGVVVWSKMEDEDKCRVGVRFA